MRRHWVIVAALVGSSLDGPLPQKSTTAWHHPYFWASFVTLGERK